MTQFQDMPLAEPVKKALDKLQFKEPTKVQNAVIESALEGKDIMACAETGSGKTGAFGIPMVERLLEKPGRRALILAPTRELARQIAEFMSDLTRYCDDIAVTTLVGGTEMYKQFKALKKKPRIVVATPGRLNDHLRRGSIKLDTTEILVLDEGDRMLDMGFAPQLDDILAHLPKSRQTHLFTATLPAKVKKLAESYLQDPVKMDVGRVSLPVEKIKQSIVQVNNREKDDKLHDELNKREGSVIVFFRTKKRTDEVADYLEEAGFKVSVVHGDRSQGQRNRAIQNFKAGKTRVLCATDVAARGIDIPSVAHVINYDLPRMEEDYVHRIGRTARNGAEGEAVSFVARQDHNAWMKLAKRYRIQGVELENANLGGGGGGGRGERGPKRYGRRGENDRRGSGGRSEDSRRSRGSEGPGGRWSKSREEGSGDNRRSDDRRRSGSDSRRDGSWSDDRRNSGGDSRREGGRSDDRRSFGGDSRREGGRSDDRRNSGGDSRREGGRSDDRRSFGGDSRREGGRSDDRRSFGGDSRREGSWSKPRGEGRSEEGRRSEGRSDDRNRSGSWSKPSRGEGGGSDSRGNYSKRKSGFTASKGSGPKKSSGGARKAFTRSSANS